MDVQYNVHFYFHWSCTSLHACMFMFLYVLNYSWGQMRTCTNTRTQIYMTTSGNFWSSMPIQGGLVARPFFNWMWTVFSCMKVIYQVPGLSDFINFWDYGCPTGWYQSLDCATIYGGYECQPISIRSTWVETNFTDVIISLCLSLIFKPYSFHSKLSSFSEPSKVMDQLEPCV